MKNIQCKRCFFFTPEWCPKKRDSLDPDLIRDCQYYRTKTNADRIRMMTDEELADKFEEVQLNTVKAYGNDDILLAGELRKYWLDWLKQECEQ